MIKNTALIQDNVKNHDDFYAQIGKQFIKYCFE